MTPYIVYAPREIEYSYEDGMRDIPEIMDWLQNLERHDDGSPIYSMSYNGLYLYFDFEEDELAFRLKFGIA